MGQTTPYVYGLCSPAGDVFYIGSACFSYRIGQHRRDIDRLADKSLTIQSIVEQGKDIGLKIFAYCETFIEARRLEELLILNWPTKLTNSRNCPPYKKMRPSIPHIHNKKYSVNDAIYVVQDYDTPKSLEWIDNYIGETERSISYYAEENYPFSVEPTIRDKIWVIECLCRDKNQLETGTHYPNPNL